MRHTLNIITDTHGSSGVAQNVVIESLHDRTILLKIESIELIFISRSIFWGYFFDHIDILIRVKSSEGFFLGMHVMNFGKLIILNDGRLTISSKWLLSWYFLTISSVMATRRGFMGWLTA